MLVVIYGKLGSGKTAILTALGLYSEKRLVYSNYKVDFEEFDKIVKEFNVSLLLKDGYNPSVVLIDEAHDYFESRLSNSIDNILGSKLLFQSRKKGMDLLLTLQEIRTLDIRFRELIDVLIYCENFKDLKIFRFIVKTKRNRIVYLVPHERIDLIFKLYDTYEVVVSDRTKELLERYSSFEEKQNQIDKHIIDFMNFLKDYNIMKETKVTTEVTKTFCNKYKLPTNSQYISLLKLEAKKRLVEIG